MATVGSINANRRIDGLIEAVASDEVLRDRVHIVAAGAVREVMRETVRRTAERYGLASRVHTPGAVSDEALAALLDRADVCAALRDPVLEAKSASLLSQMQSGTPVMVLDHGHYAEVPDDLVVKIAVDGGAAAIAVALRSLVDDPAAATALGERSRAFVTREHTACAYAEAIRRAGELALAARPVVQMSRRLGKRLRDVGLESDPLIRKAVCDTSFDLLELD